jgi:peptide/nickel transport system permease protein
MMIAMLGISIPNFFLGLLMIIFFAVQLGWLPSGGYIPFSQDPIGWLRSTTMPAISLALLQAGLLARITRSGMLEVLRQDYIRTARAKGASEKTINYHHALKNAILPIITLLGIEASHLLSGLVVIETVFNIPGLGRYLVEAIRWRDYPIVQNLVLFSAFAVVITNFIVDMLYAVIDPRIKYAD